MCEWDGSWDQWCPQNKIGPWLRSLNGDAASIVASALRDHADSARHFGGLVNNRTVDTRLRQAVRDAAAEQPG